MRQTIHRFAPFGLAAGLLCLAAQLCTQFASAGGAPTKASAKDAETTHVFHEVELTDPVFPDKPARTYRVLQSKDHSGFPLGYSLPIRAQVCTDNKCKTVEATLHWDALGYYDRYEYPPGKPLTKKEHVPFGDEDYVKLDQILKDSSSILGRHSLVYLAKPLEPASNVDGWSGATPQTVQQSVVKDAAYTTWVMWRYAHGEIVPQLRRITEQSCTPAYLKHLFDSQDRRRVDFALKYVMAHHPTEGQFVDNVFHVLETGDRAHVDLALRYLSRAVEEKSLLHKRLIESCCRMKSIYCPKVVDYFAADPELPVATLEQLTQCLDRLPYFPVHLILRMLEKREFFTLATEANISRLLDSNDFFVARRACEYLAKQDLSAATQSKVDAFRTRNRDRL